MNTVYNILNTLKTEIRNLPSTNTVTFGMVSDVDMDKTTIFPLSHIVMEQARPSSRVIEFDFAIYFLDIVDVNNKKSSDDEFYGNDNLQDVLNSQFEGANRISSLMFRGDLFNSKVRLTSEPIMEVVIEKYSNLLSGWEVKFTIQVQNEMSIC